MRGNRVAFLNRFTFMTGLRQLAGIMSVYPAVAESHLTRIAMHTCCQHSCACAATRIMEAIDA